MATRLPQKAPTLALQLYEKPKRDLSSTHLPFTGAIQKHRTDSNRIVLITDPYKGGLSYYEFFVTDIAFVEELPNLVDHQGESINIARIWVKKGAVAIHSSMFVVEDIQSKTSLLGE